MGVEIEHLTMQYGANTVVADLSAEFRSGEISVLLGPSGCGKTTTLRCIAGLEEPSLGTIRIAGRTVFSRTGQIHLPPERRNLGMVFQSYAIWPHMTVFENVALPLRARGVDAGEQRRRVEHTLALVGLSAMRDRSATQLSGGQQQRVAIARCIAARPELMLLDEPLSNLDAKLRVEMRRELKDLQRQTGLTMVFVTHDQEEAMSLADTIFLFRDGRIVQQGAPQAIYRHPDSAYVAEFLGKANLLAVVADGSELRTADLAHSLARTDAEGVYTCVIRPEAWSIGDKGLPGRIDSVMFLGDRIELRVDTPVGKMLVLRAGHESFTVGERVGLSVQIDHLHLIR